MVLALIIGGILAVIFFTGIFATLSVVAGGAGFPSIRSMEAFALKYGFLMLVIAAIVTAIYYFKFYGEKPKKVFVTTCIITIFIGFVLGMIFIGKPMTPKLVPLENVTKAQFITQGYKSGFFNSEITTSPTLTTVDMSYVQKVYDAMDDAEYSYTIKEYVDAFKIGSRRSMTLFNEKGRKVSEIAFYGDEVVSVKNGLFTHYYNVSGNLDQYTMVKPFTDYDEYQKQKASDK